MRQDKLVEYEYGTTELGGSGTRIINRRILIMYVPVYPRRT